MRKPREIRNLYFFEMLFATNGHALYLPLAYIYPLDPPIEEGIVLEEQAHRFSPQTHLLLGYLRARRNNPSSLKTFLDPVRFVQERQAVRSQDRKGTFQNKKEREEDRSNSGMKVMGCLLCALSLIFLMQTASADRREDERDIVNAISRDEKYKVKRPFCNAFTGCGRKRSFYGALTNSPNFETKNSIRLPIPIYKALIKAAASEEIRNTAFQGSNDYQLPETVQDFTIFPN